jgi:hypothetical protein
MAAAKRTGPRGGKTTRTERGAVRKTFWLQEDVAEALRRRAFEEVRTETSIVDDALRQHLGIEE